MSSGKSNALPQGIFLMCDYEADPIWDTANGYNLDLDDFSLSPRLKATLRAWASWFNSTEPERGKMWRNRQEWEAWDRLGDVLREWTAVELSPLWVDLRRCTCRTCSPRRWRRT